MTRAVSGLEGVLLDARLADFGLMLGVAGREGLVWRRLEASGRAYLLPLGVSARRLAGGVEGLEAWVEEWLAPPWYDRRVEVVVLEGPPPLVERASRRVEALGVGRRVNRYPGMLVEALWRLGRPPGCPVVGDCDPSDPFYEPPPLRVAVVEAFSWHGPIYHDGEEPGYYVVEACGSRERVEDEVQVVEALLECRPHVVEARTPVSWRLRPHAPSGVWLWFEPDRSLVGVWGLVEWMRVSWLPYSMAHGAAIGKVLTAAEAREAWKRRYLVDGQTPRGESFRPLRMLVEADMAGAARIPEPGTYWEVYQLDYSSLYPSLISRFNVSAETVARPGCRSPMQLPAGQATVCSEPRGLVSEVLGWLVERRLALKRQQPRDPRVAERIEALKWILVSGFGYLGYRNSLFGSITAYETVTALARWALSVAEDEAEKAGYRLVHSIVDSIFVQPVDPKVSVEELAERIAARVGVPVRLEAGYVWLHIPATLRGRGAVNKYYGALHGGGVKLRGILAVRRDAPPIARGAQLAAIAALAKARDPAGWRRAVEEAWERLEWYRRLVASGEAPARSLVMEKRVGEEPAREGAHHRAARASSSGRLLGVARYIMVPGRVPWPVDRGPPPAYDIEYYQSILDWAARELPPINAGRPTGQPIVNLDQSTALHVRRRAGARPKQ